MLRFSAPWFALVGVQISLALFCALPRRAEAQSSSNSVTVHCTFTDLNNEKEAIEGAFARLLNDVFKANKRLTNAARSAQFSEKNSKKARAIYLQALIQKFELQRIYLVGGTALAALPIDTFNCDGALDGCAASDQTTLVESVLTDSKAALLMADKILYLELKLLKKRSKEAKRSKLLNRRLVTRFQQLLDATSLFPASTMSC